VTAIHRALCLMTPNSLPETPESLAGGRVVFNRAGPIGRRTDSRDRADVGSARRSTIGAARM